MTKASKMINRGIQFYFAKRMFANYRDKIYVIFNFWFSTANSESVICEWLVVIESHHLWLHEINVPSFALRFFVIFDSIIILNSYWKMFAIVRDFCWIFLFNVALQNRFLLVFTLNQQTYCYEQNYTFDANLNESKNRSSFNGFHLKVVSLYERNLDGFDLF